MPSVLEQAVQLYHAGRFRDAAAVCQRLLQENPADSQAMHLLGIVCFRLGQYSDSVKLIERAMALRPGEPAMHHNLAASYRALGNFERAEHHYRTTIEAQPNYAEAYFNYSAVRKFTEEDRPLVAAVELQLQNQDLSDTERCNLHFAAGKIYDDLREFDRAFRHYQRGNKARHAEFDVEVHRRWVDDVLLSFSRDRLGEIHGQGDPSPMPIFIVGMPRSGTTLVEQILASHPEVYGAGELLDIPGIANALAQRDPQGRDYPQCVAGIAADVWRGFGGAYLKRLQQLSKASPRVTDKNPLNHQYLGLITCLLPAAKIINCRRDPLDTCLSCYFQKFRAGQEFTFDLEHLAEFYASYQRLMEHWNEVLPTPIHEVSYEKLIEDPDQEIRQLLAYCGLPWDDACLEFHRSARPVNTASNHQVRQPLYRTSLARWQNYEPHIAELHSALRSRGVIS